MRLVQVSRWADPGKAAPLTDRPVLKGRALLLTPGAPGANVARSVKGRQAREWLEALAEQALRGAPQDLGVVMRSAAETMDDAEILDEAAGLREAWAHAQAAAVGPEPVLLRPAPDAESRAQRDWPAPDDALDGDDAFERIGVWDALRALRGPRVDLGRGAWMSVEATAALTAVDVNTGDDFAKGAAQAANLSACAALPRQLRLRGLGGLVYLDLAPIKKGARQGVDAALKRAFADDPVETRVVGWTPAGAVEMQRRRERPPLAPYLAHLDP
jgi:Ribonuclease G/E